jgi:hypothetical protein
VDAFKNAKGTACESGKANYLAVFHDEVAHSYMFVLSGDARAYENITLLCIAKHTHIIPEQMILSGNVVITTPELEEKLEKVILAEICYNKNNTFVGTPTEVLEQMHARM